MATKSKPKKATKKTTDPRRTQISISVPEDLIREIDALAKAENRNRSNYICNVLLEKSNAEKS
ncbi:MAG: ribbon-helix-helix protein, CopG family [Opitutales bacterium]